MIKMNDEKNKSLIEVFVNTIYDFIINIPDDSEGDDSEGDGDE